MALDLLLYENIQVNKQSLLLKQNKIPSKRHVRFSQVSFQWTKQQLDYIVRLGNDIVLIGFYVVRCRKFVTWETFALLFYTSEWLICAGYHLQTLLDSY